MTRENVEIVVVMKNGHIGANGDSANETIDQLANGFPFLATEAIESGCIVVVHRPRGENGRPCEQPTEVMQMLFVSRAGEHFHPNRVTDRDLAFEQGFDTIAGRGPGVTKKFDPCGRINQNHVKRLVRNSPRSLPNLNHEDAGLSQRREVPPQGFEVLS